jgi:hypothetical protein
MTKDLWIMKRRFLARWKLAVFLALAAVTAAEGEEANNDLSAKKILVDYFARCCSIFNDLDNFQVTGNHKWNYLDDWTMRESPEEREKFLLPVYIEYEFYSNGDSFRWDLSRYKNNRITTKEKNAWDGKKCMMIVEEIETGSGKSLYMKEDDSAKTLQGSLLQGTMPWNTIFNFLLGDNDPQLDGILSLSDLKNKRLWENALSKITRITPAIIDKQECVKVEFSHNNCCDVVIFSMDSLINEKSVKPPLSIERCDKNGCVKQKLIVKETQKISLRDNECELFFPIKAIYDSYFPELVKNKVFARGEQEITNVKFNEINKDESFFKFDISEADSIHDMDNDVYIDMRDPSVAR